jgi:hypothetical protein
VLHAVAGELLDLARVEAHREVDDQRAPGLDKALAHLVVQVEDVGGAAELVRRDAVELGAPLPAGCHEVALGRQDLVPASLASALRPARRKARGHGARGLS